MPAFKKFHKLLDRDVVWKNIVHLHYQFKELGYRVLHPAMPDPIFIIGCSRSGTTVTFETIRQAPELRSFPYEIPQFWHSLFGPWDNQWDSEVATANDARPDHREKALAFFYARLGKGRVLDKSCINILRISYLHALFPDAIFIYIQRDGRDNVSSLIDGWRHHDHFNLKPFLGKIPAEIRINNGEFSDWRFFLPPGWQTLNHATLEEVCAHQWLTANRLALEAKQNLAPEQWIQIRYEDILENPLETFQQVFDKLQLPFTDALKNHCAHLNQRPTSIVNGLPEKEKWKRHNPEAIRHIYPLIEPMLKRLGYV